MIRLLKIELLKLVPYRTFKILFAIYLLLMTLVLLVGKNLGGSGDEGLTSANVLGFPNIWNYYTLYACYFNIILAILVIFVTCNEFTYRTLRQNIIDGLTRQEAVIGKNYINSIIEYNYNGYFNHQWISCGKYLFIARGTATKCSDIREFIFAYFIQSLGMMSMGYFFGTLFKRTGLGSNYIPDFFIPDRCDFT
jgi:ABC-2 type transport system permease protein